jgi:dipeptidyl aminopeptidase/acylaminoacyl peptidase
MMKMSVISLCAGFIFMSSTTIILPKNALLSQEPFIPHVFETLDKSDREYIGEITYQNAVQSFNTVTDVTCERIVYNSNDLKITGLLCYPHNALQENKRFPVIIYNRGGSGESGKITVTKIMDRICPLVKAGYVVIASQYGGNDGSEGRDELGGTDVNDVNALYDVIKELSFADTDNIFMIGYSRGAINSYRALQQNTIPIKACAVLAGVSDCFLFKELRPDAIPLLATFIPSYHTNMEEELTKRSAIRWIQDISTPLLLIHGNADTVVDVRATTNLAQKLSEYDKTHKMIIYEGAGHSLAPHLEQIIKEITDWFASYASAR